MHLFKDLPAYNLNVVLNVCPENGERRYAIQEGKSITLSLEIPRTFAASLVEVSFYKYQTDKIHFKTAMRWAGMHGGIDEFLVTIEKLSLPVGLYEMLVTVHNPEGEWYVDTSLDHNGWLSKTRPFQKTKPLLVYHRLYPKCKWIEGGIIYQIFIDRFSRGANTPLSCFDSVLDENWDTGIPQYPAYPGAPLKNNVFFGGNFAGIIQKIPYLAKLGVSCLYLSPICKAHSNHKYDTGDYMQIDPSFGTEDDFLDLIDIAHKYGIHIILDGVFNHTGDDSVYFNKYGNYRTIGAYQSPKSPYHDWYTFKKFPDEYESWWDIDILPKLNLSNPSARDYFLSENGVIAHYAAMGVDGFRLDVVDELDDDFIAKIKERLSCFGKDRILYGEVWEDASSKVAYDKLKHYFWGNELDGVMNYPIRTGLIQFLKYGDIYPLLYALESVMRNAPKEVADAQMNFLGTHDTERVLSALADISFDGMCNDDIATFKMSDEHKKVALTRLKMAFACLATLPGVTTLFYGDEVGMEGFKDPFNRLPYPWNNVDTELCDYVRDLFTMRRSHSVYKNGEFKLLRLDSEQFVFSRHWKDKVYITVINRSTNTFIFESNAKAKQLFPKKKTGQNILVPPMSGIVVQVNKDSINHLYSCSFIERIGN